MPQRDRKQKKAAPSSTREQRQAWANKIEQQLKLLSLDRSCPPINDLLVKVEHFVESGEAETGSIKVPEISRRIDYVMSNRPDPKEPAMCLGHVNILYTGTKKAPTQG